MGRKNPPTSETIPPSLTSLPLSCWSGLALPASWRLFWKPWIVLCRRP